MIVPAETSTVIFLEQNRMGMEKEITFFRFKHCILLSLALVLLFVQSSVSNSVGLSDYESPCVSDEACVHGGRCVGIGDNKTTGYCWCPLSCPKTIYAKCAKDRACNGDKGICNDQTGYCICQSNLRSDRCAKNDTQVFLTTDKDNPYEGDTAKLHCCLNVDYRDLIETVFWLHNGTTTLKSTTTPNALRGDRCYELTLNRVRFRDSGNYTCVMETNWFKEDIRRTIPIRVRALPKIKILEPKMLNSTAIEVSWKDEPDVRVNLKLEVPVESGGKSRKWNKLIANSLVISGLKPHTWYNVTVQTEKLEVAAVATASKYILTPEDTPGPPVLKDMRMKEGMECEIAWSQPLVPNGTITHYEVSFAGSVRTRPEGSTSERHRPKSFSRGCEDLNRVRASAKLVICSFYDLLPNRIYKASVVAVNKANKSEEAKFETSCTTDYGSPDAIGDLKLGKPERGSSGDSVSKNRTFRVQFPPQPDQINGPITCYYLAVVPLRQEATVASLKPPQDIPFQAAAGTFTAGFAYIAESYQTLPEYTVVGDTKQDLSNACPEPYMDRDLHNATDKYLDVQYKYTGFLVVRVDSDGTMVDRRYKRQAPPPRRHSHYKYSSYFQPVKLQIQEEKMVKSPGWYVMTVTLSLLLVLLMVATVGLTYFLHRKGWLKHWLCFEKNYVAQRESFTELNRKNRDFQPIAVEDLPTEYLLRHRDSDFLFAMEFEALPNYDNFDTTASDRQENSRKNRYNDIKAYDVTRVKLKVKGDNPASDYINANFIQTYKGRKTFVAAQGPMNETLADFWRMVWEHNVQSVVMVTNLHEKYRAQCTKYWPDDEPVCYGVIEVTPKEANYFSDYAIRRFELRLIPEDRMYESVSATDRMSPDVNQAFSEVRRVVQYHYTGWHDYRAPECTTGLLRFLFRLRRLDVFSFSPIVVHCSAGVGRTGTFIAVDGVLDQCEEEGKADIFGFVSNLRRQRNFMVQSLEQYVFVYKALAEWYTFGDTDVEVDKIHDHVNSLRECRQQNGFLPVVPNEPSSTKMRKEYERLTRTLENGRTSEFAVKDGNERKNRSEGVVPYDRNRVILAPVLGQVDASYINASVIRGYSYPYILAQDPMVRTKWDFWRMVAEQNAGSIVLLSAEEQWSSEERYWPEDTSKGLAFGDSPGITVKLVSEEESPSFISRKINYSSTKEKELREVVQFVLRDWPVSAEKGGTRLVPNSTGGLLELIGKVLQRQSNLIDPGPIIVHCRDGSCRSGLYCAVSLLLERLKAEGRVDVFQTVKGLQAQRAKVIQHLAQYEFCYQTVLDYLDSFR